MIAQISSKKPFFETFVPGLPLACLLLTFCKITCQTQNISKIPLVTDMIHLSPRGIEGAGSTSGGGGQKAGKNRAGIAKRPGKGNI
jgi:hypothetical protein